MPPRTGALPRPRTGPVMRLLLAALGHAPRPFDQALMPAGAFEVLPRELRVGFYQVTEQERLPYRQRLGRRAQHHQVRLRRVDRVLARSRGRG